MKPRQVTFRQTGSTAYANAQRTAYTLRSLGHAAEQGCIPSPAGLWADTVYIVTDAPLPAVRKVAAKEGLEI